MTLSSLLVDAAQRLEGKQLLGAAASVSMRLAGTREMLFCTPGHDPLKVSLLTAEADDQRLHAQVYLARDDIGAIACGGGDYARMLGDFDGALPQVFDEQARHLGQTALPLKDMKNLESDAKRCLATGGNVWVCGHRVLVLGGTVQRVVLNAELLEKCAKAFALATSTGARVYSLPWWVCRIANGRLKKDQRRAAARFAQGLLPEETKGY